MEVFVVLEFLPDQGGADHLAVPLDQAALRLLREDHARDRGHGQRIGKPRDQRQQDQDQDGGANFFQHDVSPNIFRHCEERSDEAIQLFRFG